MRNLQEQVKKAFCYQKLYWPFTVWINCSSDLKNFANSQPSASNFKSFSRSLEHFFLTVGQNNFGNKIPLFFGNLAIYGACKAWATIKGHSTTTWTKFLEIICLLSIFLSQRWKIINIFSPNLKLNKLFTILHSNF